MGIRIPQSVIDDYTRKIINRDDIARSFNIIFPYVTGALKRRGIKVWDIKRRTSNEIEYLVTLYKNKKLTREKIVEKFKINLNALNSALYDRGIDIWDRKRTKKTSREGYKNNTSRDKYFNWSKYKNHIMAYYNK